MIDDFLKELFPSNFNDRFGAAGGDGSQALAFAPGSVGAPAPMGLPAPGDGVPMPRPRPDIEGMLAGRGSTTPLMAPDMPSPPAADMFARLAGMIRPQGAASSTSRDEVGASPNIIDRLGGRDGAVKHFVSSLAGGFAGGDPNFRGGALMKGIGGALGGGLKSDKEDREEKIAAAERATKQQNFERQQGDSEKTSDALRKLYEQRGSALSTNAATRAIGTTRTAWNKPAHERWKDAQNLILNKEKALRNPLAPKADRDAAEKDLAAFKKSTMARYGFDENGNDLPQQPGAAPAQPGKPPTATSGKAWGDKEGTDAGLYPKGTYDDPARPESKEEFDALPAGTVFINPSDGQPMTKRTAN